MEVSKSFGEFFKQKRISLGLTLREFCRKKGFDPGNISKIERGLLPPPQSADKRREYARALGIEEGSDDWFEFCDLAATSAGKIPSDMLSRTELMNALPILFRTVRKKEPDKAELKELIDSIQRELH